MTETKCTVKGRLTGAKAIFEPQVDEENPNKKPKYSANVTLNDGEDAKIEAIVQAAIKEQFGDKVPGKLQNWGVRDGDDPDYEVSFGKKFINPKATRPPVCFLRKDGINRDITKEMDLLYAGCYVATSVSAYAYPGDSTKNIKPGVTLILRAIKWMSHGERLGDVVKVDNEFDDEESEDSDFDGMDADDI